jgi:hypothetical protein
MVVVAVHNMLADASSYASQMFSIPVEVVGLSVGKGSDALLASGRRSVACHLYELKILKVKVKKERGIRKLLRFTRRGAGWIISTLAAPPKALPVDPRLEEAITRTCRRN